MPKEMVWENLLLVKAGWQNSLAHQIPGGIKQSYEEVKHELIELLNEIFNKE